MLFSLPVFRRASALVLGLLLFGLGTAGLAQPAAQITLTGDLTLVQSPSVPHYEVNGYVLLVADPKPLTTIVGKHVIVTGVPLNGPTIFMKGAVQVRTIAVARAVAEPGADITVPADPIPLFGTSFYVLFGQLAPAISLSGPSHWVVATPVGTFPVTSDHLDLRSLQGQHIAAIAATNGQGPLRILFATSLNQDFGRLMGPGSGLIYIQPIRPVTVRLYGTPIHFDQAPIIGNGRTLVGLRHIGEALNAQVAWDDATKTARVTRGDTTVLARLGSTAVTIRRSGQPDAVVHNDVAPIIVASRMMVPLRVLSEGLGLQVKWDAGTATVQLQ